MWLWCDTTYPFMLNVLFYVALHDMTWHRVILFCTILHRVLLSLSILFVVSSDVMYPIKSQHIISLHIISRHIVSKHTMLNSFIVLSTHINCTVF